MATILDGENAEHLIISSLQRVLWCCPKPYLYVSNFQTVFRVIFGIYKQKFNLLNMAVESFLLASKLTC